MTAGMIRVVIVAYNSADQIAECLRTLSPSSENYAFHVTVVDNGSTDGTLQLLRNDYPSVQLIASANLGYAHGNNLAVKQILEQERGCKAILILNPDVVLLSGSIDLLAEALFSSPEIGGVSPHIAARDGRAGRLKSLFGFSMNIRPLAQRDAVISDRLHGCCMLLRPEVFRKAGFIDEQYFLYWEELDFGLAAIAAGFKLLLCYDVTIYHRCDSRERQHRIYYMWRNQFRFASRNYASFTRVLFLSRRGLTLLKELAGFVITKRLDLARAAMAGLAAGLRGEIGKSEHRYAAPSNPPSSSHDR